MDSRRPASPSLSECGKWLRVNFHTPHLVNSWAVLGGGAIEAQAVVWHRVTDSELRPEVEPQAYLSRQIETYYGSKETSCPLVGFLTGAHLAGYIESFLHRSSVWTRCVATVGLNNAVRIGDLPTGSTARPGTINILLQTSIPLSDAGTIEALSIVAEARTVAVIEGGIPSTAGLGFASGTGTDCIAVASPIRSDAGAALYAGKHTLLGHLIGASAYEAVLKGVRHCKQIQHQKGPVAEW
jgi:adenosylcobinamide amidohydrolase